MKPILVDTNAYAAFKRGQSEAVMILRQAPAIAVNAVVLGELLSGFAAGTREQHGCDLFTHDAHFEKIERLRIGQSLFDFESDRS